MKRILTIAGLVVAVLVVAVVALIAVTFLGRQSIVDGFETSGIHIVKDGIVKGVLFPGDAADTTDAGEMKGAPWVFSDSQAQDRASLVRLARVLQQEHVDVKAMVFAHSGVRTEGLAPLIAYAQKNP